jgi:hypothetical protein
VADGTVRGAFELDADSALTTLTSIRDRGIEGDDALASLGERMDALGSSSQRMAGKVTTAMQTMSRSIADQTGQAGAQLDELQMKLYELGNSTPKPSIDLQGVAAANAQLDALEARLDLLSRKSVSPSVNLAGGGGGGFSAVSAFEGVGGNNGGSRTFSTLGGYAGKLPWWAAAAPLVPSLGGAAVGILGSGASAALGAGTVGLGAYGALGAGAALSYGGIKPAITGLTTVTKAQQAYQQAYQTYGPTSQSTLTALKTYQLAVQNNPGAGQAATGLNTLRGAYTQDFAGARGAAYSGMDRVFANATRAAPALGRDSTVATTATANAAASYSNYLTQPQTLNAVGSLSGAFAQDLPAAEKSLEHISTILENLSVDAQPFFKEADDWVEQWTGGLAKASGNTEAVQSRMQGYVNSAKDWAKLTGAAYDTIRDIFKAGTPSGDSMVTDLTDTITKWDDFINNNPGKVSAFFSNAESTTESIASTVGKIVTDLMQLFNAISPIIDRGLTLLNLVSGLGPGGVSVVGALVSGAYSSRGTSVGRAAATYVTGSPSFMRGGGTRTGGGVVVGASGAVANAGRASNYETAMGRTSSGAFMMGPATEGTAGTVASRLGYGAAAETGVLGSVLLKSPAAAKTADVLTTAAEGATSMLTSAARFALPVVGIMAALQAISTPGGVGAKASAGFGSIGSLLTLGHGSQSTNAAVGAGSVAGLALKSLPLDLTGIGAAAAAAGMLLVNPASTGASLSNPTTAASIRGLTNRANNTRTPAQLRSVLNQVPTASGGKDSSINISSEMSPADQAAFSAAMTKIANTAASNAGAQASNTYQTSFESALSRGDKPQKAIALLTTGLESEVKQLGPKGATDMAGNVAQWVQSLQSEYPKLRGPLQQTMDGITTDINKMHDKTLGSFKDLQTQVFYYNGQIYTGSKSTWGDIQNTLVNSASVASEKLGGIFAEIQKEAINALTQMGLSSSQASYIVTNIGKGGQKGAIAKNTVQQATNGATASGTVKTSTGQSIYLTPGQGGKKHATGGMFGGDGLLDTVGLPGGGMAAPGETWIANRHTMNKLSSATLAKYGLTAQQMINGETRAHSSPMYATGGSFDISAPSSGLSGYPGALDNQASKMYTGGMNKAVNTLLGQLSINGPGGGGGGGSGGTYYTGSGHGIPGSKGVLPQSSIERLWIAAGGPPALAHIMAAIADHESGGEPGIVQQGQPYSTTGWGLWQITPGNSEPQVGTDNALLNGLTNARAAVAKYHTQGLGAWTTYADGAYKSFMQRGGQVDWAGWNAKGGSFTTNGPTMLGVGEKGKETVTVTPLSQGGGKTIKVVMEKVYLNGGDPGTVKDIAEEVASRILDAIDGTSGGATDRQLSGAAV